MIVTLLEHGWFNQPDKSPVESVYLAKFEDAVRLMSVENALKY
jgi:hypothetical protein